MRSSYYGNTNVSNDAKQTFTLDEEFLAEYKTKIPKFDVLGIVTYYRTYSRVIESEKRNEVWWETVRRVVEGTVNIQRQYCLSHNRSWSDVKARKMAHELFALIFDLKMLPPGRGLQMHGTDFAMNRDASCLFNCAGVSTADIDTRGPFAFCWTFDMLMKGSGVSGDLLGAGKITITKKKGTDEYLKLMYPDGNLDNPVYDLTNSKDVQKIVTDLKSQGVKVRSFLIDDSREGWIESLWTLLMSYFGNNHNTKLSNLYDPEDGFPIFDYSVLRPKGAIIRSFGGKSSGPKPLFLMHERMRNMLNSRDQQVITSVDIGDLFDYIAYCVVSGNIRRSSVLLLGDPEDDDFVTMKDPELQSKEPY